jgi:hypothetical protein
MSTRRTPEPLPPIALSGMTWLAYAAEEVKRDPALAIKPEPAAVAAARDERGLRWERVAACAGIKVSEAHKLYEAGTGKSYRLSHTGRGRNFAAEYQAAQKPKRRSGVKAVAKEETS